MGTHADGVVFYGYDLGDMTDRDTWESTAPAWLVDPFDGETYRQSDDELAARLGWDEARGSYEERDQVLAKAGISVTLGTYGVDGAETTWYVAIEGTETTATYECLPLGDLTVQPDWADRLRRFMELLELPSPGGEPGWFVTSSYG